MKSIGDLLGMPIVALDQGTRMGKVNGAEVDAREGRLRYLHFDGEGGRADGVIPWEAVRAVGTDAITIESTSAARESLAHADRDCLTPHVGDRPVVTESGTRLGTVHTYDVDEVTGQVLVYHIHTGGLIGRLTRRELRFTHDQIRTFGKDAIIVADEVEHPKEPA